MPMNIAVELRSLIRSRKTDPYVKNVALYKLKQIADGEPGRERDLACLTLAEAQARVKITDGVKELMRDLLAEAKVALLSEVCPSELDRFIESRGLKKTTGDPKRLRKLWEATARK